MRTLMLLVVLLAGCSGQGEQGKYIGMTSKPIMIGKEKCESITEEYEYSAHHWIHCPSDHHSDGLEILFGIAATM